MNGEQELPTFTANPQLELAEPGPIEVRLKTRSGCAANCKYVVTGRGVLEVHVPTRIPSVTARGPPVKASVVPLPTSEFQGGPGGVDEGSESKATLVMVTVIVPAEPVFRSPTTEAD